MIFLVKRISILVLSVLFVSETFISYSFCEEDLSDKDKEYLIAMCKKIAEKNGMPIPNTFELKINFIKNGNLVTVGFSAKQSEEKTIHWHGLIFFFEIQGSEYKFTKMIW
jgi:hypothetical protein